MIANLVRWRRVVFIAVFLGAFAAAAAPAVAAQQAPKPAEDQFVPIDELPPDERMPAAPFVIAAYAVAWLAVAVYLWSIWRRLGRVEREIAEVARRLPRESRR